MRFFRNTHQPIDSDTDSLPNIQEAKLALQAFVRSRQNRTSTEDGKPPQYAATIKGKISKKNVRRLLDLVERLKALNHPNIIKLIAGNDRATAFSNLPLVLPYYQMTLEQFIHGYQTNPLWLTNHTAQSFSIQLAKALAYLADQNIIHGLITPQHICVTDDHKQLMLIDFYNSTGIKKKRDGSYPTQSASASIKSYQNSQPGYRSPALAQRPHKIKLTPNLDLPGFAITLLQIISRTMDGPVYSTQTYNRHPALDGLYTFNNEDLKQLILTMYFINPSQPPYIHDALKRLRNTDTHSFQAAFRNPMPVDRAPHYRAAIFSMHEITASLSSFNTYTRSRAYETIHGGAFGAIIRNRSDSKFCAKIALNEKNTCSILFEASILRPLNHPNIIRLIDNTSHLKNLPLVMPDYLYDLEKYFKNYKNHRESVSHSHSPHSCAIDIARGLAYLDAKGVIHGDLKPNNILVSEDHAVITDFGMSIRLPPNQSTLTLNQAIRYIQPYRPPEIKRNQQHFSAKCDIYAFGILLLELARRQALNFDFFIDTNQRRPAGIHPELYNLIYSMTRVLTRNRPPAEEVVETLEKLPKENTFRLYRASRAQTRQHNTTQLTAASCA